MQGYNSSVFFYIKRYIEKKFPLYHRVLSQNKLLRGNVYSLFIDEIVDNILKMDLSVDKSDIFKKILSGDMDNELQSEIENIGNIQFNDISKEFNIVREHILNIIRKNNKYKDSDELIDEISMDIALRFTENISVENYSLIVYSNYVSEYLDVYYKLRNKYKVQNIEMIKKTVQSSSKKIIFDSKTKNAIYNEIANEMLENYGTTEIYDVDKILSVFTDKEKKICNELANYIKTLYHSLDMNVLFEISMDEIIDFIQDSVSSKKMNMIDVINGEHYDEIINFINKKYRNTKKIKYVLDVLQKHNRYNLSDEKLLEYSKKIVEDINQNNKYNVERNLINKHYDAAIIATFNELVGKDIYFNVKENSVVKVPSKDNEGVLYNAQRKKIAGVVKKISISLVSLLLLSTLSSHITNFENTATLETVAAMNEFDYKTPSFDINNVDEGKLRIKEYYDSATSKILINYMRFSMYGDEYSKLCFYDAFSQDLNIDDWRNELDKLREMDKLFSQINSRMQDFHFKSNLLTKLRMEMSSILDLSDAWLTFDDMTQFGEISKVDGCCLDYIYNYLKDMGCKEIEDKGYYDAISEYKNVYLNENNAVVSNTFLGKSNIKKIRKMISLYKEYSEKSIIELKSEMDVTLSEKISHRKG